MYKKRKGGGKEKRVATLLFEMGRVKEKKGIKES
jgi:hypothetical protein